MYAEEDPSTVIFETTTKLKVEKNRWVLMSFVMGSIAAGAVWTRQPPLSVTRVVGVSADVSGHPVQMSEVLAESNVLLLQQALLQRARGLGLKMKGASADTVLRQFSGENVRPADLSRIRIMKGRGTKRLIIEWDHAGILFRYRRELKRAILKVLKTFTVSPEDIEFKRSNRNWPDFQAAFSRITVS
jgi:hypothetical protein